MCLALSGEEGLKQFASKVSSMQVLIVKYSLFFFLRLSEEFSGAATVPFSPEITQVLMSPINESDVEIKPDGTLYK